MKYFPGQAATFTRTFTQVDFDRFASLSGDDNPIHVDAAFAARTLFGRTVAHGMFLYSQISCALGSLLPGPGTLPVEHELVFPAPSFTGEEMSVSVRLVSLLTPGKAELETQVTRPDGTPGCQGRALVWLPGASLAANPSPMDPATMEQDGGTEGYKGLFIRQHVSKNRRFAFEDLQEYLDLSWEANPIYYDRGYAKKLGFIDTPLPPPMLGALFSDLLGTRLPGRGTNWLKQRLHFLAPAYPGDLLTAHVQITRIRPEKDLVNLATVCQAEDGRIVCEGEALVRVKDLEMYRQGETDANEIG